jgi:hypothetical protein
LRLDITITTTTITTTPRKAFTWLGAGFGRCSRRIVLFARVRQCGFVCNRRRDTIRNTISDTIMDMKKLLATTLLLAVCASPVFASRHKPKTSHHHYNYKYKAPKNYKPHFHNQKQKQHHPA